MIAVIGDVDAGVNVVVGDPAESGNLGVPLVGVVAPESGHECGDELTREPILRLVGVPC